MMSTIFTKTVRFHNQYTNQIEVINLQWAFENGFPNMAMSKIAVEELGQDPDKFAYLTFNNQIYAASMESLNREIVIARDCIWYRIGDYRSGTGVMKKCNRDSDVNLPYTIKKAQSSSKWNGKMIQVLNEFDKHFACVEPQKSKCGALVARNCMVLLGIVTFNTLIPVYELNCVDSFFANPPSRENLFKKGVIAINPFSGEQKRMQSYHEDGYTFKMYLADSHMSHTDVPFYPTGPCLFVINGHPLYQDFILKGDNAYPTLLVCVSQEYQTYIAYRLDATANPTKWIISKVKLDYIIGLLRDKLTIRSLFERKPCWIATSPQGEAPFVAIKVKANQVIQYMLPSANTYGHFPSIVRDKSTSHLAKIRKLQKLYGTGT